MTSKTAVGAHGTSSQAPSVESYVTAHQVAGSAKAMPTQAAVEPSARVSTSRETGDVRVRTVPTGTAAPKRSSTR